MSKEFKIKAGCVISLILLLLAGLLGYFLYREGCFVPFLKVNGEKEQWLEVKEVYEELGARGKDRFRNIDGKIERIGLVDTEQVGDYEILYHYKNVNVKRLVHVVDTTPPKLELIGGQRVIAFANEPYEELGARAWDGGIDLSDRISIESHVDSSQCGVYEVLYSVSDEAGNETQLLREVEVVENPTDFRLHYHYDMLDNTASEWWFEKPIDQQRNKAAQDEAFLAQYQAYYLGKDEKVIYLTFDEGGNDITYIKEISDVLNENDVDATFFLTRNYIIKEADFMRDLVKQGHIVANHTRNHLNMCDLANETLLDKFVSEIKETEKAIMQVTLQPAEKVFRFPKGEASERALKIVSDMGYKTFFWSYAYYDYGEDVSEQTAYEALITHLHPGAIYLLHPSNRGNYEAMDAFIKQAKKEGYRFALVNEI